MGWEKGLVGGELVPPLLCNPSCAAALATSSQGQGESWEMGERHREICTWIIPVSNPFVPLFLLPSPFGNYSSGVWYRLFPGQVYLSTQNI